LILLFVGGWVAVNALLSIVSGWTRLAPQYRFSSREEGERFTMVSGAMGYGWFPVNYQSCLNVTVNPSGFSLSVFFIFRILAPQLFFPWTSVENVREERFILSRGSRVFVRGHRGGIWIFGKAGKRILEKYAGAIRQAA
jgi:hypothetical protein